jgi:hypothetical protein
MFYRPNYCCHCGEKIDRIKWTPLTSRRFCDFCKIEQMQHDLLPRAVLVVAILFGLAGLVPFGGRTGKAPTEAGLEVRRQSTNRSERSRDQDLSNPERQTSLRSQVDRSANGHTLAGNLEQRTAPQNSSTDPVYFCGQLTKKGTPCTRRVKSRGRCWQHGGPKASADGR